MDDKKIYENKFSSAMSRGALSDKRSNLIILIMKENCYSSSFLQ